MVEAAVRHKLQLGHSEFAEELYVEFADLMEAGLRAQKLISELFAEEVRGPVNRVCRHLAKIVSNSFSAVLLLCFNGFGHDAIKVVRSMLESALTLAYLAKFPNSVEDYLDFAHVDSERQLAIMQKYSREEYQRIPQELLDLHKSEFDKVADRFREPNGRLRRRWIRKNLREMAVDVGAEAVYDVVYPLSSSVNHGDINGLCAQLSEEPDVSDAEIAPSRQFLFAALHSAHHCFIYAVEKYVTLAIPDKSNRLEELRADFEAVWAARSAHQRKVSSEADRI